jgi:hypothetical protein
MRRWTFSAILVALAPLAASAEPPPPAPAQAGAASSGRAPASASALASEGFTFLGEEKGIRVHRREKRAGVEFAAETNFAATPEQVRRALLDYPNQHKWHTHLEENKILSRGADSLLVYQRLDLPVIDDRDYTLQVTWGAEGPILWTRFAVANERGPKPVDGVVRVTAHAGAWRLEPDGGKGTRAVYRFHLDVAGSVPAWLGKDQAKDGLLDFFVRFKRELPNYR